MRAICEAEILSLMRLEVSVSASVETENVGGASTNVADLTVVGDGELDHGVLDTLVVEGVVARPDLGGDTGDVR